MAVWRLAPQVGGLFGRQLGHEFLRKSALIAFHGPIQRFGFHAVELRQIRVEQLFLPARQMDQPFDLLDRDPLRQVLIVHGVLGLRFQFGISKGERRSRFNGSQKRKLHLTHGPQAPGHALHEPPRFAGFEISNCRLYWPARGFKSTCAIHSSWVLPTCPLE